MVKEDLQIIENIVPLGKNTLNRGLFLCLFGTDKIPPHLGLIANGNYYSASAKGCRIDEDVNLILRKINQSKIPSLFIELDLEVNESLLQKSFSKYPKLKSNQTCLLPIKDYINSIGLGVSKANFVYELIPILVKEKKIQTIYSVNRIQSTFELRVYTKQDIANRILKLQETC